MADVIGHMTQA